MLQNIVQNIWSLAQIIFIITLIIFFFCLIIIFIGSTLEYLKISKIKDESLKKLQKNLNNVVLNLNDQSNKENVDKNS